MQFVRNVAETEIHSDTGHIESYNHRAVQIGKRTLRIIEPNFCNKRKTAAKASDSWPFHLGLEPSHERGFHILLR